MNPNDKKLLSEKIAEQVSGILDDVNTFDGSVFDATEKAIQDFLKSDAGKKFIAKETEKAIKKLMKDDDYITEMIRYERVLLDPIKKAVGNLKVVIVP